MTISMLASRSLLFLTLMLAAPHAALAQWSSPSQPPPQEGWGSTPIGTPLGASPGPSGAPMLEGDPALRVGRLEEQLRTLNGQVEQLQFQNKTLQEQLRKVQEDNEFRFQQLESGKKGAPPSRTQQRTEAAPASSAETFKSSPQLGAPPRALGQLPVNASGEPVDAAPQGAMSQPLEPLPGTQADRPGFTPRTKQAAVTAGAGSPDDEFDLAYGYMLRGDYDMAENAFRDFLTDHPKHPSASKAEYWLGESQYQRKQYKSAAESFLKVYNEYPGSEKAPESLLRLGMSLKALGQKEAACATFSEVGNKYPKSSTAVKKRVQTEQKNSGC
jgi:tol-pal system protein YbgF